MDEYRIPTSLLEMKITGKRPKARLRRRWPDQVKRDKERKERSWGTVEETQEWTDRDTWRLLCKRRPTRAEVTQRITILTPAHICK